VNLGIIAVLLQVVGCSKDVANSKEGNNMGAIKRDSSTPEGAILCLEDAYRAKDVDAAIACKDFRTEARLMLEKFGKLPKDKIDTELVGKTAEVLELAYRQEMKKNGFPDMTGVTSTFPTKEPHQQDIVVVTAVCKYPDGGTSQQKILVALTDKGWRVLNPVH
jgi:hypothetical protein